MIPTRSRRSVSLSTGWLLALALLGALPVAAQGSPAVSVAGSADRVTFSPAGAGEGFVLTVSSPAGEVVRQEFAPGAAPTFSLFDKSGNRRPDGTYTWELQATRTLAPALAAEVARAREAGDDETLARLRAEGKLPAEVPAVSGSFAIRGGAFVVAGEESELAVRDQVIPDDLIVQSSLCVGFDCVNNENFGFDTIRLKENNLRIKFEDTSVGTFPTNDWQLTANDSASGGQSKFSIDDITGAKTPFTVTAGASTNSIFVDSTGRVGFRTSTPVLDLHVNTSNTPALRLEQNNSGGFTAQTWDVAGNEANFFVRDVTGGSKLPLRIRPGAPTSSIDIDSAGKIGIGTAAPTQKVEIKNGTLLLNRDDGSAPEFRFTSTAGAVPLTWFFRYVPATGAFQLTSDPGGGNAPFKVFPNTPVDTLRIGTPGAGAGEVVIGQSGVDRTLRVFGQVIVDNVVVHADYVFDPDYELESIEEHAKTMWEKRALPAVEPAQPSGEGRYEVDLGQLHGGVLAELEKAHIYIEQLHSDLATLKQANQEKEARLAALEEALTALQKELAGERHGQ